MKSLKDYEIASGHLLSGFALRLAQALVVTSLLSLLSSVAQGQSDAQNLAPQDAGLKELPVENSPAPIDSSTDSVLRTIAQVVASDGSETVITNTNNRLDGANIYAAPENEKVIQPASVIARGADFRVIQTVTEFDAPDGSVLLKTNQFKISGPGFEGEGLLPGIQSFDLLPTVIQSDDNSTTVETVTQFVAADGSLTSKRTTFVEFKNDDALKEALSRPAAVSEWGPHAKVMQKQILEPRADGKWNLTSSTYTHLETGVAYQDENGQWQDSVPELEIVDGGVVGRKTSHKVALASSPIQDNPVDLTLPTGGHLRSRVLGLGYFDRSSGKSVVIAEIQDSQGQLGADKNEVVYADAFKTFSADLRYVFSKAGLEQDVVLNEQPPAPEDYGLDSANSQLEVITEFFPNVDPQIISRVIQSEPDAAKSQAFAEPDLVDDTIDFGPMQIGYGRAFALWEEDEALKTGRGVTMTKRWQKVDGRTILFEAVSLPELKPLLQKLPLVPKERAGIKREASLKRTLPKISVAESRKEKRPIQLAKASYPKTGVLLDYSVVSSTISPFTFASGTTYRVVGMVTMTGGTTIQGGAIIKYASGAILQISNGLTTPASTKAFLLAETDNSMGDVVVTGAPVGTYAGQAISLLNVNNNTTLANLEIRNAVIAIDEYSPTNQTISNCRIVDSTTGVRVYHTALTFANLAVCNVGANIFDSGSSSFFGTNTITTNCTFCAGYNHGNSIPSALLVTAPSSTAGAINCAGDENFFKIVLGSTTFLNIYTTGATDTQGYLLSSAGVQLATDDNSGNVWNFSITTTLNAGTYYIRVRHATNGTGSFRLNVATPSSWTPLVSRVTSVGSQRNNHDGYLGFQFTVGSSPISVKELGRWIYTGNSSNHVLKLFNGTGTGTALAQVTLSTAGQWSEQFAYAPLSPVVALAANTTYTLMSTEVSGGDYWWDYTGTQVVLGSGNSNPMPAWAYTGGNITTYTGPNVYGPVDLHWAPDAPPTITSTIGTQTINEDTSSAALNFTVGDAETPVANLTMSGGSSNPTLIPVSNIVFGGSGANRTVTITPALNQNGNGTVITLTVSDGTATASTTFTVNVTPVNDPPTITAIPNQTINQDSNTGPLAFTIGDVETAAGSLSLSATSSNTNLVPVANIVFGGSGASRTVTVSPTIGQSGNSTITVIVSDGSATASSPFVVTVLQKLPTPALISAFNSDHSTNTVTATPTGATFRYTINGVDPDITSTTTSPTFSTPTTVKARAYQSGYAPSDVATLVITTNVAVTFSPNGHNPIEYSNGPLGVLMTADAGSTIIYKAGTTGSLTSTTSGSSPSIDGIDSGNGTIQAYAYKGNTLKSSTLTSLEYSFRLPQPTSTATYPAFTSGTLTLNDAVAGVAIRYTTDGVTPPITSSTVYSSPLTFSVPTKVLARAYKAGYLPSGHITAWVNQLPPPTMATASGPLTGNITNANDLEVWLLPNFGFGNAYGETHDLTGWFTGNMAWDSDVPSANFLGSFKGGVQNNSSTVSASSVSISYGRTYSMSGWYRKEVAGSPCDYAGLFNYSDDSSPIYANDVNENGYAPTYLTAPLSDSATTAQVANAGTFNQTPLPPEYWANIFTPLTNFDRTTQMKRANQPNDLVHLFQLMDASPTGMKVAAVNGNVLTLQNAYHGPTLPIGTPVGRRDDGWSFQYQLLFCPTMPLSWTYFSTQFTYIRAGTDLVRLLDLPYSGSTKYTGQEFWEGGTNDRPKLYYTLNGSTSVYTQTGVSGPLKLTLHGNNEGTINLGQRGTYYIDSALNQRTITFKVATPQILATLNAAAASVTNVVTNATVGAAIYYTTNGTDPTTSSTLYNSNSPPVISSAVTTRWKAFKSNYTASDTAIQWAVPVFNPLSGTYPSGQNVTITAPAGAQLKVFQPFQSNPNVINPGAWVLGSQGTQPGFTANGAVAENTIETRRTPYGTAENVWVARNLDNTTGGFDDADGGWDTTAFTVDKTKLYRFSVWMKKTGNSAAVGSGYTWLGCGWSHVSDLTGTSSDNVNTNPYFWVGLLPSNDWYLVVGYVHPAGDLGTINSSKVYNTAGEVVFSGTDFRWLPTTTVTYHRAYLYYSTVTGIQQEFWNPRVEVVNSVTDPIDILLATPESSPKTITLSGTAQKPIQAMSYSAAGVSGVVSSLYRIDSDGDGLPDDWEMQYFGATNQDANGDYDGDGFTNSQEYSGATNPTDGEALQVFTLLK